MSSQKDFVKELQQYLKDVGMYDGGVDGDAGPKTRQAFKDMVQAYASCAINCKPVEGATVEKLRWGSKVSPAFRERVLWIRDALNMPKEGGDWLMTGMAFETGRTFDPAKKNAAGSSGTGLIQFMRYTAVDLGTTVEALAKMTAEDQLNYVYKYFLPYKGRLNSLGDVYLAILYPKAIGKDADWVMWKKGTLAYEQNKGLDKDKDCDIERQEVIKTIEAIYVEGENYVA